MPTVEHIRGITVISPDGDVGHREMARIREAIADSSKDGENRIVLDLGRVEHINFSTLGTLVERRSRLQAIGGDLRLAAPSAYIVKILRFAGAHDTFETFPTLDEALDSYAAEQEVPVFAGLKRSWVPRLN